MVEDMEAIMRRLPGYHQKQFAKFTSPTSTGTPPAEITNSNCGALSGVVEGWEEPEVEEEKPTPKILGDFNLRKSHVQVFDHRYIIKASIQIPGMGTYWMKFQNLLVAEDALVTARGNDPEEKVFSDYLYKEYLLPLRPTHVEGRKGNRSYDFAASAIYDQHDRVAVTRTFTLMQWENDIATNLLLVSGTQLVDVPLLKNHYMTNPKSPRWEGDVP